MSVLHTLRKRNRDPTRALYSVLNELAAGSDESLPTLLFGEDPDP
jgi:hypothetical protein